MVRTVTAVFLTLVALLASPFGLGAASARVADTGFSISNPKFLDYYQHRGGARTLGYPISREFELLGMRVQLFQRAALQLQGDGGVGTLNLLDEGLLPYTRINGSAFPVANPLLVKGAPPASDPDYAEKALAFVRAYAPDRWNGLDTNFYATFLNSVTYADAFPDGNGNPGLLPLMDLELWGLPTSRPTYDPNNGDFVYLRFQRGIMHFDKSTGLTQGILIGEYLKAVLTGQGLPADLERDARNSRLYRQYDNRSPMGVARPSQLPGTKLFAAFEMDGVMVLAPKPDGATPQHPESSITQDSSPRTQNPEPRTANAGAQQVAAPPNDIAVTGSEWFVERVKSALNLLSSKTPIYYSAVRQYVYRIEQADSPYTDAANRRLLIDEGTAFPDAWRSHPDNQAEWLAGLIVHNATHVEQAARGEYAGFDATEEEARLRQKDVLLQIETTGGGGQFSNLVGRSMNGGVPVFGCWEAPDDPR